MGGTNLTKLLEMARLSNALIVGPTFVGKGARLASWGTDEPPGGEA